jgi:DNA polymerase (family 10)
MSTLKSGLCNSFELLSKLEDNQWKSRAYRNAVQVVRSLTDEDLSTKDSFTYLRGIGIKISSKIIEFRTTGKIQKLQNLLAEKGNSLPSSEYKVRKGYVSKRLSYSEMTQIINQLGITESDNLMLVGSYRRKSNTIADIDVAIFNEQLYWDWVGKLSENPHLTLLVSGEEKSSFKYDNSAQTQIDLDNCSHGNKWTQLLHHTGSKDSNIRLRGIAKKLGYKLNQYGLEGYDGPIESEEDIFKALQVPYVPPELR